MMAVAVVADLSCSEAVGGEGGFCCAGVLSIGDCVGGKFQEGVLMDLFADFSSDWTNVRNWSTVSCT
jgi:hypothetical protein